MEKSRLKGRLYFYPRPPRGGRPTRTTRCPSPSNFYPRPPRGGRRRAGILEGLHADFYPRPPRGGRRFFGRPVDKATNISIHALREEGDHTSPWNGNPLRNFYPRPPRGGRQLARRLQGVQQGFLSTPSARRATGDVDRVEATIDISIHALREEGDDLPCSRYLEIQDFYPRPPRGGRRAALI